MNKTEEVMIMENSEILKTVNNLKVSHMPKRTLRFVRQQMLNAIGLSIAGAKTEAGRQAIDKAKAASTVKECTVIGDGVKVSEKDAFLTNLRLCHLGQAGSGNKSLPYHPGSAIIHAALAAGELLDAKLEDVATCILFIHELTLHTGETVRQAIWPQDHQYPDSELISYLSLPRIARIIEELTMRHVNENRTNFTTLFLETLSLLQPKQDSKQDDESPVNAALLDDCACTLGKLIYTRDTWRQCLTMTSGLRLRLVDHFVMANVMAFYRAITGMPPALESIKNVVLMSEVGLLPMIEEKVIIDEANRRIGTAAIFFLRGGAPNQSWFVTAELDRPEVSRLTDNFKFTGDVDHLMEYIHSMDNINTSDLSFRVQVHTMDGRIKTGKIGYPTIAFSELIKITPREQYEHRTVELLGQKKCDELYGCCIKEDNVRVTELLQLTYPRAWPLHILKKTGLFKI